jgi:hypothetical protein
MFSRLSRTRRATPVLSNRLQPKFTAADKPFPSRRLHCRPSQVFTYTNRPSTHRKLCALGTYRRHYFEFSVVSSNLSILPRLESIAIGSEKLVPWNSLDPGFRTALQNTIRLPSIKEVDIQYQASTLFLSMFSMNAIISDACCSLLNVMWVKLYSRLVYVPLV